MSVSQPRAKKTAKRKKTSRTQKLKESAAKIQIEEKQQSKAVTSATAPESATNLLDKIEEKQPAADAADATPAPEITVLPDRLLQWAARLKVSGNFGFLGNGANFANHMVRDSFRVDGKEISLEQASKLIRPFLRR